jgi:A/G-specific adenine glycosylase
MPWRATPDPYLCWLSEIMLQQTTFQTVLPYYERFLASFPTVSALAAAKESDVLKAWEGLGYYARARNLHKAARHLVEMGWPQSAAAWAEVLGVGPYTAAALASVLLGEKVPVVDGNVARVFSRFWRLTDDFGKQPARARLAARLQPLIEKCSATRLVDDPRCEDAAGIFNQAMMELGALVCTPTQPRCADCPLSAECAARQAGDQSAFPRKGEKKALPVREVKRVIIRDGEGRVLLVQNRTGGLLKGLWDLPAIERVGVQTQAFTHFRQEMELFSALQTNGRFVDPARVPLTTATRKALAQEGARTREDAR